MKKIRLLISLLFIVFVTLSKTQLMATESNVISLASNQFGFDLYKKLSKSDGNLFFSPLSIEVAIAMTSAGAQQETLQQIISILHLKKNYHSNFKNILKQLKGNKSFQLLIANQLWGTSGTSYDPEFLKQLIENYNATLVPLDFKNQTESSRVTINQWVEKQTENKIKDLLKPGVIKADTELVLTNAVYFKGNWDEEFDKSQTTDDIFYLSTQQKKSIPFMHMKSNFNYAENAKWQYLQIPYKGKELVMEILLPRESLTLTSLEQKLNLQTFSELALHAQPDDVIVALPRFKAESEFDMEQILATLGMPLAFDSSKANFKGIRKLNPGETLYISKVIHKAYVDVNETGTEAAAATAVVAVLGSALVPQKQPKTFKADRPFLFFIRHLNSGSILFMGRYSKP